MSNSQYNSLNDNNGRFNQSNLGDKKYQPSEYMNSNLGSNFEQAQIFKDESKIYPKSFMNNSIDNKQKSFDRVSQHEFNNILSGHGNYDFNNIKNDLFEPFNQTMRFNNHLKIESNKQKNNQNHWYSKKKAAFSSEIKNIQKIDINKRKNKKIKNNFFKKDSDNDLYSPGKKMTSLHNNNNNNKNTSSLCKLNFTPQNKNMINLVSNQNNKRKSNLNNSSFKLIENNNSYIDNGFPLINPINIDTQPGTRIPTMENLFTFVSSQKESNKDSQNNNLFNIKSNQTFSKAKNDKEEFLNGFVKQITIQNFLTSKNRENMDWDSKYEKFDTVFYTEKEKFAAQLDSEIVSNPPHEEISFFDLDKIKEFEKNLKRSNSNSNSYPFSDMLNAVKFFDFNNKNIKCKYCDKYFTPSGLGGHMSKKHLNEDRKNTQRRRIKDMRKIQYDKSEKMKKKIYNKEQ